MYTYVRFLVILVDQTNLGAAMLRSHDQQNNTDLMDNFTNEIS